MITDDEVLRLFERADPARFDDAPPVPDAAGYLDALRTRSINVQLIETDQPPTEPAGAASRHRWPIIATAAAAVVLVVAGVLVLTARDDSTESVVADAPESAAAEAVARGFLDAYAAYDADRAMTYLAEDALARGRIVGVAEISTTPEEFRLELANYEASGFKQIITDCEQQGETDSGVRVRCAFDFHQVESDALGLGPYSGSYWDVTVRDGKVVSATSIMEFGTNGAEDQTWGPFYDWVSTNYPEDAAVMYAGSAGRVSEESIRLWREHVPEYLTSRDAFVARADAICTAANDRLDEELGAAGVETDPRMPAYAEAAARILDETLVELRAIPAPEASRAEFDHGYALVDQLAGALRGGGTGQAETIDQIDGVQLGLTGCTFSLR